MTSVAISGTTMCAVRIVARAKSRLATGDAEKLHRRVEEVWPVELDAVLSGMHAERDRCDRIVEAFASGANRPDIHAILSSIACMIRSGEGFDD